MGLAAFKCTGVGMAFVFDGERILFTLIEFCGFQLNGVFSPFTRVLGPPDHFSLLIKKEKQHHASIGDLVIDIYGIRRKSGGFQGKRIVGLSWIGS